MIVAAHQPSYLPWLGYLDKMAKADVFVVMDDLPYEDQNFQNRNRLKLNDGPHWISVPLLRGTHTDRICDKRIDNAGFGGGQHWQPRTWQTLVTHYGRAPFFTYYAPELEDIYRRRWDSLVELDLSMLDLARAWLDITGPVIRASTLQLTATKTERIVQLCERLGAKVYLSGAGASREDLDTDLLAARGITVTWQHFVHPTYPQRYPGLGFCSNLGFLDLVFNCGRTSTAVLSEIRHEASARR